MKYLDSMQKLVCAVLFLLILNPSLGSSAQVDNEIVSTTKDDFILTDTLSDGEIERRIKFRGILALETGVSSNDTAQPIRGPKVWQVASGKKFIQLIYDDQSRLVDCEYMIDAEMSAEFRKRFKDETETFSSRAHLEGMNVTLRHLESIVDIDDNVRDLVNYKHLRRACKRLHKRMKSAAAGLRKSQVKSEGNSTSHDDLERTLERSKRASSKSTTTFEALMPGTKWCGSGSSAGQWQDVGSYSGADLCCREHDHCPFKVNGLTTNYGYFNFRLFTVSHCDCDERVRRDALMLVRVPGTQWCGVGSRTTNENELGGFQSTDRCCRIHDLHCPFFINTLTENYGLYNWRAYTLNHCDCDERFRTCLKMTNTAASNMVGKIFFNIVQTKCFVLKPETVCSERLWWGRCVKSELEKRAYIRDPLKY